MNLDSKYWGSIEFVVLAKKPMLAMNLETNLTAIMPELADKVYSYESYEQAFSLSKASKQTGVIIISSGFSTDELNGYFKNLSRYYEDTGFPCVKCLLLENDNLTEEALEFVNQSTDHILILRESSALTNTASALQNIAQEHSKIVKTKVLPNSLVNYVTEYSVQSGKNVEIFKKQNLLNVISTPFNLNWFEKFQLENQYLINFLKEEELDILQEYKYLESLFKKKKDFSSLSQILAENVDIPFSLFHTANFLYGNMDNFHVQEEIQRALSEITFRTPPLIKGLSKIKEPLQSFLSKSFKRVA